MTPQRVAQAISALAGGSSVVTTTFTSSGTFTKNAADLLYILHIISGGAGGGRRDGGGTESAGGGGGGGLFTIVPASLISASTSVVVGSGGAAGGSNTNGGAGGNSSFGSFIVYGAAESSYLGRGSGLPGGISPPDAIYYGTSTYQLSPFSGSFEVGQNLTNAYVSTNPVFFTIFGAGAGMYREGTTWYNTHIRTSPFAGSGGTQASPDGTAPGGGGAAGGGASNVSAGAGARGEVRVYAIRA
jgi:hypothetical protein